MEEYQNKNWLEEKYLEQGLSCGEVAKIAGTSGSTIRRWLSRFDIPRVNRWRRGPKHHFWGKRGQECSGWKGGRGAGGRGYIRINTALLSPNERKLFAPMIRNNAITEHRLVVARALGRPLKSTEVVHHINGKRDDNRLENLELFPKQAKHSLLTLSESWQIQGLNQEKREWQGAYFRLLTAA